VRRFGNISDKYKEKLEDTGEERNTKLHSPGSFPLPIRKARRVRCTCDVKYIGINNSHEEGYEHSKDYRDLRVDSESGAQFFGCQLPNISWNQGHKVPHQEALKNSEDVKNIDVADLE
jgi:hypothetical protein